MDMTLSIVDGRIQTTLYEKPMNLHLYNPPSSAHPPGLLPGMVQGMLFRIYTLCTDPKDMIHRTRAFFNHLQRRGWKRDVLLPLFHKGIPKAQQYTGLSTNREHDTTAIFLHLPFHPQNPSSSVIQKLWKGSFNSQPTVLCDCTNRKGRKNGVKRVIVCYHRPHNLGNLLSYRTLPDGPPVSSFGITDT